NTKALAGSFEPPAAWRSLLSALDEISAVGSEDQQSSAPLDYNLGDQRMAWITEVSERHDDVRVRPIIQSYGKNGWSKGRPVALERLYGDRSEFDFLTDADTRICNTLECDVSRDRYGYTEYSYYFDTESMIDALVDHPALVGDKNRQQSFEIVRDTPSLVVNKSDDGGATLSFTPRPKRNNSEFAIRKESPNRFAIITFDDKQRKVLELLKEDVQVPSSGVESLMRSAQALASIVPLHSEVAATDAGSTVTVDADASLHAQLLPYDDGLQLQFYVRPFGDVGGFFTPGVGNETVIAAIDGETRSTCRDKETEIARLQSLTQECPFLIDQNPEDVIYLPTAEEALDALMTLERLAQQHLLTLHWPKGETMRIAGAVDESNFSMNIRGENDWFAASGKLRVNEELTLDMMELFDLAVANRSRFVQMDDGRFIALTQHFRQQIESLRNYGTRSKDQFQFPAIRAAAVADLTNDCDVQFDKSWKDQLKKVQSADRIRPRVPKSFAGELRDYQVDGFKWMSRLAHWGAGACLADDMGLGKTLQTIAILLARGGNGPALVVVPTSVAFNWVSEIQHFAPTLNPILLGDGDRSQTIADLGPRDVLICSYGLLITESESLQSRNWTTAILDEAQAIKNADTKRSEAAMALTAEFRVVLTGTPMENHLGELWNLFQFINPGLLGSESEFQSCFAIPIGRDQNANARRSLKRLIQPFILRRTKSQVLEELPPRTEITVQVQLGDEEAAMYEALRQTALNNLADANDSRPMHIRILGELMRMRRFCCHPDLVAPEANLSAAKLEVFRNTVSDLIDGGHKVLIFSQFVDHLQILKTELESMQVAYQYLDGSTPAKRRKSSVEAFQNGDGDAFLISLKAGGVGLNLTAADYVIHMDPWWNPAVEDQASDRAHRMGQQRPVTIYRFITEGTIEERILQLHATKRDLADSLLEGTEASAKLSTEELVRLIRE
ncbi:MAG: DEAD/DEAH box helicase, partial [Planctomycetota bacterium]